MQIIERSRYKRVKVGFSCYFDTKQVSELNKPPKTFFFSSRILNSSTYDVRLIHKKMKSTKNWTQIRSKLLKKNRKKQQPYFMVTCKKGCCLAAYFSCANTSLQLTTIPLSYYHKLVAHAWFLLLKLPYLCSSVKIHKKANLQVHKKLTTVLNKVLHRS